jgi:DNA polymerase-3 subunit delta'
MVGWDRVHGHDVLVQMFEQAWRRGRLAHAYLFVGQAGIGKRLFAQELARALLCENQPPNRLAACERCPACALVAAGTHPDLFTLSLPEERNVVVVEPIQDLCRSFSLRSARGRGKIAILDDADDMNAFAANCFLKTLEEPPPRSVFVIIGTSRARQRATIVSRCQVIPFAPLTESVLTEVLRRQELPDVSLIGELAKLGEGSPGQALALADRALWQMRGDLVRGLAADRPETVGLASHWTELVQEAAKEAPVQRRRARLVLHLLIAALQDALRVNLGGKARLASPEDVQSLRRLAGRVSPDQLLSLIDRCLEADEHLGRYVPVSLVLEALMDALGQIIRGEQTG